MDSASTILHYFKLLVVSSRYVLKCQIKPWYFPQINTGNPSIWQQALFRRGFPLLIFPVCDGWSDE
ncbi:hypothetical protein BC643_1189 [Mangrovibacterium diazotrophicum]|uniref:Uncharacterized protein n=1 Tax=Mangrovibacterium diazotrophicum TaxID=1261403 RepID=A0A419W5X4_9BACT|nr:hypothetical protein BC643_1189 [Mangrovibacterium diazotrophicum]